MGRLMIWLLSGRDREAMWLLSGLPSTAEAVVVRSDRGTCLNRGCIPTKTLLHTAEVLREIRSAAALGIEVKQCGSIWPR